VTAPLVILGPTGSGKSDVAMALAQASPTFEIVAVDAMQVYRGMDIGTAKPSRQDRSLVRHHCLDLADPSEEFAVTEFARAGAVALAEIASRDGTALLVGGTGLYLRSLTDPMEVPGRWPVVRVELERRVLSEGVPALHAQLAALDPLAASRIDPGNERRVVRALEVVIGSGRRFSSYGPGINSYAAVPFEQVGLRWPRSRLAARIEARVHRMMADGLLDEVRGLLERAGGLGRTARQALGYKELIEHLEGRTSLDEAVESTIVRTRQFAVRQERWFRRDPRIRWIPIEDDPVAEVIPIVAPR